jgi:hypothetical protein
MYHWLAADACPRCGERALPPLTSASRATARACQACGHVQELDPATGRPSPPPPPKKELPMESYATIEYVPAAANPNPQVHLDCVYAVCTLGEDRAGPVFGMAPHSVELVLARLTRTCACGAGAHVPAPGAKGR